MPVSEGVMRPAEPPKAPPKASLKSRTLRAGGWTVVAHLAGQVLRLVSSLVHSRSIFLFFGTRLPTDPVIRQSP